VFEPGTFVPVAQAVINSTLDLLPQPTYGDHYNIDRDPVWLHKPIPTSADTFAWYQCDQLGTPMELTDADGQIAWSGVYQSWGLAQQELSVRAKHRGTRNPIRFQGQYFDAETGLHYNRNRYYDPIIGRFASKDPIGYFGGFNLYSFAPNPTQWIDPLGLARKPQGCPCDTSPPNPDGRRGKESTRNQIEEIADNLEYRGWTVTNGARGFPEEYLSGPGGARRGSSYPDITATKNDRTLRINTVDTLKDGLRPDARERRNALRIRAQRPGDHLILIPKPKN
jgi:RHS repeat-associated protein